jgi:hypothetical protein
MQNAYRDEDTALEGVIGNRAPNAHRDPKAWGPQSLGERSR